MKSSLEHKTVRPGSLSNYSFYYSHRNPPAAQQVSTKKPRPSLKIKFKPLVLLLIIVLSGYFAYQHSSNNDPSKLTNGTAAISENSNSQTAGSATTPNMCAENQLDKFIKVSIKQRKLWACEGTKIVKTTPVITGIEKYEATETPLGTYQVYAKQADTVLSGQDEVGKWSYPVDYWMPFLDNQYGTYGFHDATWRNPNEFGNIDAHSSDKASHGCVELPLGAMQWLYEWAPVGTTLTVTT